MATRDFLGKEWKATCMGCGIADGTWLPPGGLVGRTEHFCVHQDPLIALPGFMVIGAVRHIHSIAEMADAEYNDFAGLLKRARCAIATAMGPDHVTIVQEERSVHFHAWFFPWIPSVIGAYGQPSLTKIRHITEDLKQKQVSPSEWAELEMCIGRIRSTFAQLNEGNNDGGV
jgi:hypothetical protein